MIVRPRPGALQLFFILRGSILPKIAAKIDEIIATGTLRKLEKCVRGPLLSPRGSLQPTPTVLVQIPSG